MRSRSHADRRGLRRVAVAAAATAAVVGASAFVAPAAYAAPVEVQILATNDFHGRIAPNASNAAEAGAAKMAGVVNALRAANPNTVFAAAGDLIGASTFESFIQSDKPTIDALNAAGLEVSAVGNHELDQGYADLVDRVMAPYDPDSNPLGGAEWEYIAANLKVRATGDDAVPATWIKEFGGVQVGFVGAVTEELPSLVNPAGIADLEVRGIVESVNAEAAELVAAGADVVVMLVHEGAGTTDCEAGIATGTAWGEIVRGVSADIDAIVSGHTHLAYNCEYPVQSWIDQGRAVTSRPVVSAGQYGTNLNRLTFRIESSTGEVQAKSQDIVAIAGQGAPADDGVAAIVAAAVDEADELGAEPLGTITADFNRAKQANGAENRGGESTLGNLVADAQLWSARRTDPATQIAFMNPGGLRADMAYAPDGTLTYREAANVQSFANTLVTLDLTGAQIREALEQQWQPAGATRPFLKLGVSAGFEYVYDPAAAPGARITRMTLDGADIDPAASYRVVANSFLAAGGDNFAAIGQGTGKRDTGQVDLASMVDFMGEIGTATPDYAQRSVGATLPAPGPRGYEVGSVFDIPLASLDFSTTEPRVESVDVLIGGQPAGSAAVVPALPETHADGSGAATVTVTVPEGIAGDAAGGETVWVPLTITTPAGTNAEIPIPVFDRAESATIGIPNRLIAKAASAIQFTTIVVAENRVPVTGEVTILDGTTAIATATLTDADRGRVKVKLPELSKGVHRLSASYAGSDTVTPSQSTAIPVLIW